MPSLDKGAVETIYAAAYEMFTQPLQPNWVTFFRDVLGQTGMVRKAFPTPEKLAEFEKTETYSDILGMLTKLRERQAGSSCCEPIKVVTVRLPRSVHEVIRLEAHEKNTSMNKLCISKLMQSINAEFVPKENWQRGSATEPQIIPASDGADG